VGSNKRICAKQLTRESEDWMTSRLQSVRALIVAISLCTAFIQTAALAADSAIATLKRRALSGESKAQIELGARYLDGRDVKTDFAESCKWYKMAADSGDADGLCSYGCMLIYGRGCKQDQKLAKRLFERAYKMGSKVGAYQLGVVYEQGLGVPIDNQRAFNFYQEAAIGGINQAMNNLASMNARGAIKAKWSPVEMYKKAAEAGSSTAEYNLGMLYLEGDQVQKNEKLAVEWLRKASQHGHMQAQNNLGVVLVTGGDGVPINATEGIRWLKKAATAGDDMAKQALSKIYREGKLVKQDLKEAIKWEH
jgi:FOG: TPR repeat, SEL1 subfamily